MGLTDQQLERYSRQLVLPEFGAAEQEALKDADVLVVGAGALGTIAAGYLAAAGVGRIGLVDGDAIELSNLQRQLLYSTSDVGKGKGETAAGRLNSLNPDVLVEPYPTALDAHNAIALAAGRSCVLDCADNLAATYAANDACVVHGTPLVTAGVLGFEGQITTVLPGESPCYRCMFPERDGAAAEPPTCSEAGIAGPAAGILGSAQALEAMKVITGLGRPLAGRILHVDGLSMTVTSVEADARVDCSCRGVLAGLAPVASAGTEV